MTFYLESDDDVFSEETFSDEDFSDWCSSDHFFHESPLNLEDSEAADLLESVQNTVSEDHVVLDATLCAGVPRDLLDKILARLPLAAHFRYRCVSKRWKNLATSPGWLQLYAQVKSRPSSTIMCRRGDRKANFYCYSELKWFNVPHCPFYYHELDWELVDVDAGLICYQCNWNGDLWLCVCNPLTQSSRVLPPNYPRRDSQPPNCEFFKLVVDRQTQTFKIVILVHSSNPLSTVVYDSTTLQWTVHQSFPPDGFRVGTSFLLKDVMYSRCSSLGKLLAFDVNSGVWSKIDTELPCRTFWIHFIINHNDRVLLIQPYTDSLVCSISVWMLVIDPSKSVDFSKSRWVELHINIPLHLKSLFIEVCTCFSQTDRICFGTVASNKWITYSFATRSWDVMPTRGQRNAYYDYFNWEPSLDVKITQPEI